MKKVTKVKKIKLQFFRGEEPDYSQLAYTLRKLGLKVRTRSSEDVVGLFVTSVGV